MAALVSYDSDHEDDPSYNNSGTQFSRNQLAEQWYAYKLWSAGFTYPHTLGHSTVDAVLRKEFRL